jgi:hypothetical protein
MQGDFRQGFPMRRIFLLSVLILCACRDNGAAADPVDLPRESKSVPDYQAPVNWDRTGKELMPLDNIGAALDPVWRPVESCELACCRFRGHRIRFA